MDAIVLAGGNVPEELAPHVGTPERALIEVGGRPILHTVVQSLKECGAIGTIAVVSNTRVLETLPADVKGVEEAGSLVDNLMKGLANTDSDQVLVVTADIPLVTGNTWNHFLDGARQKDLQAAYAIVPREAMERDFPGGKRTYLTMPDGTFTGGNAFLLPRQGLAPLHNLIDTAYSARKNPLRLARLLGFSFILGVIRKRVTIARLEEKMSSILGCKAGAVVMAQDPSIAFDVDKQSDLEVANSRISGRANAR